MALRFILKFTAIKGSIRSSAQAVTKFLFKYLSGKHV